VHGIVVASYRLKPHPEVSGLNPSVGASGAALRPDGVLFELYQAPRRQPGYPPRSLNFPLYVSDLDRGLLFFNVNGENYWAILWVGKRATAAERSAMIALLPTIHVK
jgi:hypothetical protein